MAVEAMLWQITVNPIFQSVENQLKKYWGYNKSTKVESINRKEVYMVYSQYQTSNSRNRWIPFVAAFGAVAAIMLGLFAAKTFAAGSTVVVTPNDTQGWYSSDTRAAGKINYISDSTSPYPTGALRLTTTDSNADKAQYMKDVNVPLSSITELSYNTKQVSGPPVADASYQLEVYLNGGTSGYTTLVFEPYWNGVVTPGVWQQWDVSSGQFWSSKTVAPLVASGAGGPPFYTLSELKAAYPNAVVKAAGVNVGSYNPNYNVEIDGVNINGTIYDFELVAPLTNKDQCKNNGYMTYGFKNQGQCVASVQNNENSKLNR